MALTDENGGSGMIMPVAPMYGGGYGNSGFGGFGGADWGWIILLLLFAGGGWGNGFGGYGGNIAADSAVLYPWMNQSNQISDGFRDQMMNTTVTGIQNAVTSGFGDVQTALCSGFAGVNAGISNGFAQAEIAANARQIADMQQNFSLSQQFAQCCCDNRLGLANLGSDIAREACADRAAVSDGVRDILASQNAGVQRILDQMCNDKIDAKNEKIADLERQLTMANLAASQGAQTAALVADNNAQTAALINRIAPYPVPSYTVANPYGYANSCGCGCGG